MQYPELVYKTKEVLRNKEDKIVLNLQQSATTPALQSEPKSQSKSETKTEPKPRSKSKRKTKLKSQHKPQPKPQPQSQLKTQLKTETIPQLNIHSEFPNEPQDETVLKVIPKSQENNSEIQIAIPTINPPKMKKKPLPEPGSTVRLNCPHLLEYLQSKNWG